MPKHQSMGRVTPERWAATLMEKPLDRLQCPGPFNPQRRHGAAAGRLERKALLARHLNQRVDELVESARSVGMFASFPLHRHATAPPPHQPPPPDQILISLTHRVVMNLQAARNSRTLGSA